MPHLSDYVGVQFDIQSPLHGSGLDRSVAGGEGFLPEEAFVSGEEFVLSKRCFANYEEFKQMKDVYRFIRAGPRMNLCMEPSKVRAAIVTCGGLCPGLNVVIRELVMCLWFNYRVREIYGIIGGYEGFYTKEPIKLVPDLVKDIHAQGGTIMKSSRGGFDGPKIVEALKKGGFNMVFAIGGDGTHRGIEGLYNEIRKQRLKITVAGIPKTIDNDIPLIDRTFGFDTAVEEANRAINAADCEAISYHAGIGLVKLMGRNSGFIAKYATLSNRNVNICLIPEEPFDLDGPKGLLEYIVKRLSRRDHAVIVVAEGAATAVRDRDLRTEGTDASGNPVLYDIGSYLRKEIVKYCKSKGLDA